MAMRYAELGASDIVIVARSVDKLNVVKTEISHKFKDINVHVIAQDLSSKENCKLFMHEALKLLGNQLDYLVLNHITNSHYG